MAVFAAAAAARRFPPELELVVGELADASGDENDADENLNSYLPPPLASGLPPPPLMLLLFIILLFCVGVCVGVEARVLPTEKEASGELVLVAAGLLPTPPPPPPPNGPTGENVNGLNVPGRGDEAAALVVVVVPLLPCSAAAAEEGDPRTVGVDDDVLTFFSFPEGVMVRSDATIGG